MKKTELTRRCLFTLWALLFACASWQAMALSRDDIDAQKQADQRRGYGTNYPSTGLTRTIDPNRPTTPGLESRGISPSNLTPEQQRALEARRKAQEEAAKAAAGSKGAPPSDKGAPPTVAPKVVPPGEGAQPSTGKTTSTGRRGGGKSIEMISGKGAVDPGYLRLALFRTFPEDSTDTVRVTVNLNNARSVAFDEVCFTLRYDPGFLEFIPPASATRAAILGGRFFIEDEGSGYPHAFVRSPTEGYVNYVEPEAGIIRYMAHSLNRDPLKGQGPLANILFRIRQTSGSTDVKFVFTNDQAAPHDLVVMDASHTVSSATVPRYWTLVAEKAQDRLGDSKSWLDGTLDVTIVPRLDLTAQRERLTRYLFNGAANPSATPEDYGIRIKVVPSVPSVVVGEEFDMQIVLENPNRAPFDAVQLFLAYNPATLLPLDHDEDNWIREGINVFDGDFRAVFPFDVHLENSINMLTGLVDYRMKRMFEPLTGEGTLATIRFVALAPISGTRMKGLFHVRAASPTTGVFRNGKDVLGWTDDLTDGVDFVTIEIRDAEIAELPASQ